MPESNNEPWVRESVFFHDICARCQRPLTRGEGAQVDYRDDQGDVWLRYVLCQQCHETMRASLVQAVKLLVSAEVRYASSHEFDDAARCQQAGERVRRLIEQIPAERVTKEDDHALHHAATD